MLRISQVQPVNHHVTLRLEGSVAGPWVAAARDACENILSQGRTLRLDLADVEFMDSSGVALVADLTSRGVVISGSSPFVEAQLRARPGTPRNEPEQN
ncbi:MAG: STAS domain-containing protein [Verrucomicrobia subdivision 3 bacterium]|nr:STAS domain-containing protein [Limisphaerales bacterium]